MLIETPYKKGDVITVRLITGEEVVAGFIEESDTELTVDRPAVVFRSQEGMGLMPLLSTVEPTQKIRLRQNVVMLACKTNQDIASVYTQQVTGLTVPGK